MRAAIYIRVSTEEQTEGYSLAAQERACSAYARSHGWVIEKVYADEGMSGRRTDRPALQELLKGVSDGKIQAVIVHKLDRLARNLRLTLEIIEGFGQHKVAFVSVSETIDLTTPFGWAALLMKLPVDVVSNGCIRALRHFWCNDAIEMLEQHQAWTNVLISWSQPSCPAHRGSGWTSFR